MFVYTCIHAYILTYIHTHIHVYPPPPPIHITQTYITKNVISSAPDMRLLLTPCAVGATARWGFVVSCHGMYGRINEERPVWSQFLDPTSDVNYYYNHYTQVTVWYKPAEVT